MHVKKLLIGLIVLLSLMMAPSLVEAALISNCTFDKAAYRQGEIGILAITIYNDKDSPIRVTELTATINYFYDDANLYLQTFYTDATLPVEIQHGQSEMLGIPFSLPTNIAPGYIEIYVKAKTELWNSHAETWYGSDHPTDYPILYVESRYKDLYEGQRTINSQLLNQLEELQTLNTTATNIMYLLGITTLAFAVVTIVLIMFNRRTKAAGQSPI